MIPPTYCLLSTFIRPHVVMFSVREGPFLHLFRRPGATILMPTPKWVPKLSFVGATVPFLIPEMETDNLSRHGVFVQGQRTEDGLVLEPVPSARSRNRGSSDCRSMADLGLIRTEPDLAQQ